jgi:hypothetical protein
MTACRRGPATPSVPAASPVQRVGTLLAAGLIAAVLAGCGVKAQRQPEILRSPPAPPTATPTATERPTVSPSSSPEPTRTR